MHCHTLGTAPQLTTRRARAVGTQLPGTNGEAGRGNKRHLPRRALAHPRETNPSDQQHSGASGDRTQISTAQLAQQVERLTQLVFDLQRQLVQPPPPQSIVQPQPKLLTNVSPFNAQRMGFGDRRLLGGFDARFHSTAGGATPPDYRVLPDRIVLVRHAESQGNVDGTSYSHTPDSQVELTERGVQQARAAGEKIKSYVEQQHGPRNYRLFFYTSPYKRSLQTFENIASAFPSETIMGVQEEVQLREQDFGNFQDPEGKRREKADRLRFGRFYYRFPDGESGADVYDRLTIFEDHLIRDINAGRFARNTSLVLVTHGLALRIFLMRWFHWTVDQFLSVFNPDNAEPLVLERIPSEHDARPNGSLSWVHTKTLYRLTPESMRVLRGCTNEMCATDHRPRGVMMRARDPFLAADTVNGAPLVTMSSEDEALGSLWGDPCAATKAPGLCEEDFSELTGPGSGGSGSDHSSSTGKVTTPVSSQTANVVVTSTEL